jgi:hypothetical protein
MHRVGMFVCLMGCVHAPPRSALATPPLAVLALERWGDMHVVAVSINGGRPITLLVDTGAEVSGIDKAVAARLQLASQGVATFRGIGGSAQGEWIEVTSASVSGFELLPSKARWGTTDMKSKTHRDVEGVLGMDVLGRFQLFFDNSGDRLELRAPSSAGPLEGLGTELKTLDLSAVIAIVEKASAGDAAAKGWMLDTGAMSHLIAGAKTLTTERAGAQKKHSFYGIGGEETMQWSHLDAFAIDGLSLRGVPISWRKDRTFGPRLAGLLGASILDGFDWQFDPQTHLLRLQENHRHHAPDTETCIGARLVPAGDESQYWVFGEVEPDSPAGTAGIHAGDLLWLMNGDTAINLDPSYVRRELCRADGSSVVIQIVQHGKPSWVQFHPQATP